MKKKTFYHKRIKSLSVFIVALIVGLTAMSFALPNNTQGKKMTAMEKVAGLNSASLAFTPMAITKKMKDSKTWDKLDDGQQKFMQELEDEINNVLKDALKNTVDQKALDDAIKDLKGTLTPEQMKSLEDVLKGYPEHAKTLENLKDNGVKSEDAVGYVMKGLMENDEKVKTFIKNASGTYKFEIPTTFKSQQLQNPSDIATHTIGDRVPGIGQIPVRQPLMKNIFRIVNTNLEYIKYIDQETIVRDAKNVATATASTHNTKITWKERSIQITNVRDLIDVPLNMLADYDFVEGEVTRLIDTSVQLKVDRGLLKDDGVYPNLHSVNEKASEFDASNTLGGTIEAWTNKVQTPNIFDLVIAMSSQIIALGQDGSYLPDTVLFNTIDRYKSLLIKDKNDQYILPPFVVRVGGKEYNIEGMRVQSNPLIDSNSLYVFDSSKGTIYARKTAVVEMSMENNNNFEIEVATLKGYERLNFLIRNVDANAFMKCSDIQTAIASITKP